MCWVTWVNRSAMVLMVLQLMEELMDRDLIELLAYSVSNNASDLHLAAGAVPMIRVDGQLQPLSGAILSDAEMGALLDTLDERLPHFYRTEHEQDLAFSLPGLARFRVNVFRQQRGRAAVFRVIPKQMPALDELAVPESIVTRSCARHGLILVSGVTGSGKSTTLAALLDHINRHYARHLLTIEDPIEFIHSNKKSLCNQREIGRDSACFASALRAALREDPDVIMVGELRDLETIRLALTAAETGHLVLATLHAASAAQVVDRIIDVFPAQEKALVRTLLANSLSAVLCQQLLPALRGGRIAAYEAMIATPAIRNLIRENKTAQIPSILQTGRECGMQTMEQAVTALQNQGRLTEDVLTKGLNNDHR